MVGDILQPSHLFFVLVVALLVLGPKRLPEVGRALGNGLRDFKSAVSGDHEDHHKPGIESSYSYDEEDDLEAPPEPSATPASPHTEVVEPTQPAPDRLG